MPCGLCHLTPDRYQYSPLNERSPEIRLLRPHKRFSWLPSQTLRFNTEIVQLSQIDDVSPYYAISYAWGQNVWSGKICLDGHMLRIPRGAEEALRGVLKNIRAAGLERLPLWIDAVCINQQDHDDGEKSHQVGIMGDVFARARCVLIWLGIGDYCTTKRATRSCRALKGECLHWTNEGKDLESNRSLPPQDRHALPYMRLPPPRGCRLEDFYALLRYRWFSRLWVVQEVVLAKQAMVFCGRHRLSWDDFAVAIQWARHRTPLWDAECVSVEDFQTLQKINKIISLKEGQLDLTLEALLIQAFRFDTTEPLDKVYGLLGLVAGLKTSSNEDEPIDDIDRIRPDYEKPLVEVYAQATWLAMKQEKSLELLSYVSPPRPHGEELTNKTPGPSSPEEDNEDLEWPSWVPKYHQTRGSSAVSSVSPGANAHNDFEAIIAIPPSLPFVLEAHGISLGTITRLRIPPPDILDTNMFEGHDAVMQYFSYLWETAFLQEKGCSWTMDRVRTAASALVCGHYSRDRNNPHQDAERDPATVADFAAFMLQMKNECSVAQNLSLEALLQQCCSDDGDAALYAKSVKYFAQKFVHLEIESAKLGVGDKACQAGDEVCIIFGARQPFVLRKTGEAYTLLGTAYVAGVMKGEYVQELEDSERLEAEDQVFQIR